MAIVPFAGFERALAIESGGITAIATLDVGPRVLFLGETGGPNLFHVPGTTKGRQDDGAYHGYGGHRLWTAPEDRTETYAPENAPPIYSEQSGRHIFEIPANVFGISKRIEIAPLGDGGFGIRHTIRNESDRDQRLAPWGITVMAPGGECIFPQAEFVAHTERLLPARPLVLWGYTRMSDLRLTWGEEIVRLCQDGTLGPLKIGALIEQGIAIYSNFGHTFVKRFAAVDGADYPDMGCNFETYTRHDMLEVESLAPLKTLRKGDISMLDETWYVLLKESAPENDTECAVWLRDLMIRCPHLPLS